MSNSNTYFGFLGIEKILAKKPRRIHFSGIGGVGMYSLAALAVAEGFTVSGSDRCEGEYIAALRSLGADIKIPENQGGVMTASLLVYSLAVDSADSELAYARSLGIPTVSRADFLSYLEAGYKTKIAVSGAHGKSTVTAMLAEILKRAGLSPTVALGAAFPDGTPLLLGGKELLLYEACEYRDSFLCLSPDILLINNIELDHTDYFESTARLCASFEAAARKAPSVIINTDGENARSVYRGLAELGVISVGTDYSASYRYTLAAFEGAFLTLTVSGKGGYVRVPLGTPGKFNAENAAIAATCALQMGVECDIIEAALKDFRGLKRRLEYIGHYREYEVYYDYAHHPSEIRAALSTVRLMTDGELTAVFKPHTYTRTAALWDGFVSALSLADRVLLCDIYPARERAIEGISSERLAHAIGERATYCPGDDIIPYLTDGGALVVLGAGMYGEAVNPVLNPKKEN
ncbi:MAG: hypothetical protein IIX96_02400 [Clostridia bacterium]|nr:hypothetical protein [Clostridia bacterium]